MSDMVDRPITAEQTLSQMAPMELDLIALFSESQDIMFSLLNQAEEQGWTPERYISEVEKALTNTPVLSPGERIAKSLNLRKPHKSGRGAYREFQGLKIVVEQPRGSYRRGNGDNGPWVVRMIHDYGYIINSRGADGEGVDVYIGRNDQSPRVFVVRQVNPKTGKYDEDKVMLGFSSPQAAKAAYMAHYAAIPEVFGDMEELSIDDLKQIINESSGPVRK